MANIYIPKSHSKKVFQIFPIFLYVKASFGFRIIYEHTFKKLAVSVQLFSTDEVTNIQHFTFIIIWEIILDLIIICQNHPNAKAL